MSIQIYHNPRCSKSRETLTLLKEQGVEPEVILYLETPPSIEQLEQLLQRLRKEPTEILRFKEAVAKELALKASDDRSRQEWLQLMVDHPKLIERPIVVNKNQAVLGRPPELVLEIL